MKVILHGGYSNQNNSENDQFFREIVKDINKEAVKVLLVLFAKREEMQELEDAFSTKVSLETLDALTDILYVVYGMGARLGFDMDEAYKLVHENNMSKLCFTVQEAIESVEFYKNNPQLGYESPSYRLSADNKYYVVYNEFTKKILKCNSKSREWKPVNLTTLI